jgi:hypothetical protein
MQPRAPVKSFEESRGTSESTQFVHTGLRAPIEVLAMARVDAHADANRGRRPHVDSAAPPAAD